MEQWVQLTTIIQNGISTIALIAGGLWAYFRFIRFRTLQPRLEFKLELQNTMETDSGRGAIILLKLSNKGNTKIDLRKNNKHRCHFKFGFVDINNTSLSPSIINRKSKDLIYRDYAFEAHSWIEPSETIDDVKIIFTKDMSNTILQTEITIFGEQKWSTSAAFLIDSSAKHPTHTSEDEQEEYSELEAAIEDVKTSLQVLKRNIFDSLIPEEEKEQLNKLIGQISESVSKIKNDSLAQIRKLDHFTDKVRNSIMEFNQTNSYEMIGRILQDFLDSESN